MKAKKIVFVGGDKRQYYAARKLIEKGLCVYLLGFDKLEDCNIPEIEDIKQADIIVLPITGLKSDSVPVYYSEKEIKLNTEELSRKTVIMGKSQTLKCINCKVIDLLWREDFAVANALPSAEGAVMIAMQNFEGMISSSKCLVVGYGRIGKALSRMLRALNAEVTVASRSSEKSAYIKSDGNKPLKTDELNSLSGYDIIFNTADALVINKEMIMNSDEKPALIIDLASAEGGVDFNSAKKAGIKTIHALSLPGRFSPKSAGEIISDAIVNILEEE